MLRITFVKRIAVLGCLLIMAALIPTMASAANPVWVKIAENGITNPANQFLFPGVQFHGKLMIGSDPIKGTVSMYAYNAPLAQFGSTAFGDPYIVEILPYAL